MVIELVLLFAFAAAIGVAVVKAIEWRFDAQYGPYLARERVKQKHPRAGDMVTYFVFAVPDCPRLALD
jgi:hypothetical protein